MTILLMGILMVFMAYLLLWGTEASGTSDHFLNSLDTSVLRGFWSLVVILVHVPLPFQNTIQDLIGSFAYIGVTFFFMVSAYGLKKAAVSRGVQGFWTRRLPKLLIPMAVANLVNGGLRMLHTGTFSFSSLLVINSWIKWLLVCYLIFWAVYRFERIPYKDLLISGGIIAYSLHNFITSSASGWPTEIYGFIWGILLANGTLFPRKETAVKPWIFQCLVFCAISLVLGVLYLKYKPVVFWGNYLLKIALGLMILCFLLCVHQKVSFRNKVGLWLGSISYEIYLTHASVMTLFSAMAKNWGSGTFIIVSMVVTILLSALEHWISGYILTTYRHWRTNRNG